MTSAHVEVLLFRGKAKNVDGSGRVLLKREGFHDHEVVGVLGHLDVDEFVDSVLNLEEVGVGLLADLALKGLPKHADQVVRLPSLHFGVKPVLQAFEVDESHTTCALARNDAWVFFRGV